MHLLFILREPLHVPDAPCDRPTLRRADGVVTWRSPIVRSDRPHPVDLVRALSRARVRPSALVHFKGAVAVVPGRHLRCALGGGGALLLS